MKKINKTILEIIQNEIPLIKNPFLELSKKIKISNESLIQKIKILKKNKIIRKICPIYDTKILKYKSSLIAFKVKEKNILNTINFINSHPGVSHNYKRNNNFNIWFTIAIPPDTNLNIKNTIKIILKKTKPEDYIILPSKKTFKIGVKLNFSQNIKKEDIKKQKIKTKQEVILTNEEKKIISISQNDIPIISNPFKNIAKKAKLEENYFINQLQIMKKKNIIRRFAALISHKKAGFVNNGMTLWTLKKQEMIKISKKAIEIKNISHCYERKKSKIWNFNFYCMIHSKNLNNINQIIKEIDTQKNPKIIYSTKEFKKKRIKYYIKNFYYWEKIYFK